MTTKPKGKHFQLPTRKAQRIQGQINGRISTLFLSMASSDRIREETPFLRGLYEFLARPLP